MKNSTVVDLQSKILDVGLPVQFSSFSCGSQEKLAK